MTLSTTIHSAFPENSLGRVYLHPSHPAYGPVRRMWVILVQLDLLDSLDKWYSENRSWTWDEEYAAHYHHSTNTIPASHESKWSRKYLKFWLSVI